MPDSSAFWRKNSRKVGIRTFVITHPSGMTPVLFDHFFCFLRLMLEMRLLGFLILPL